jgi:hypothetical protein
VGARLDVPCDSGNELFGLSARANIAIGGFAMVRMDERSNWWQLGAGRRGKSLKRNRRSRCAVCRCGRLGSAHDVFAGV